MASSSIVRVVMVLVTVVALATTAVAFRVAVVDRAVHVASLPPGGITS
jgi:hypothetical protein